MHADKTLSEVIATLRPAPKLSFSRGRLAPAIISILEYESRFKLNLEM